MRGGRTQLNLIVPDKEPPASIPADARALFARRVVAVHPGVGNAMRQWPPEHFASLIDLLVEKNAVNVVLIGGPEEAELAQDVLGMVGNREAVVSLAGRTSLRDLPALLSACALRRQQLRPEAHRRRAWRPDDRHSFGCGGRHRMGTDRQARRCTATEYDVQPLLPRADGGLSAQLCLHAGPGAVRGAGGFGGLSCPTGRKAHPGAIGRA